MPSVTRPSVRPVPPLKPERRLHDPESVQFSGLFKRSEDPKPGLNLAARLGFATAIMLAAVAPVKTAYAQSRLCTDVNPTTGAVVRSVDRASDLPWLQPGQVHQNVVDLCNNPYFSVETRDRVEQLLDRYRDSGVVDMLVVVVPQSNASMKDLGDQIIRQMRLGDGNGVVVVVNRDKVYANVSGKMGIAYDLPYRDVILPDGTPLQPDATRQILVEKAQAHIDRAMQLSDPAARQREFELAVTETVEALEKMLREQTSIRAGQHGLPGAEPEEIRPMSPEEQRQNEENTRTLLLILAMLAAAAGTLGTGVYVYRRRKPLIEEANELLTQIGSEHKANMFNVHSFKTVRAVLAPTAQSMHVDTAQLMDFLSRVAPQEKRQAEKRKIKLELGLNHPNVAVRVAMIKDLYQSRTEGNTEDTFNAFMDRFSEEREGKVLKALEMPLVEMVTEENAYKFENTIDSPLVEVRRTGIRVLNKFFNPDPDTGTMKQFYELLERETDASINQVLQDAIAGRNGEQYAGIHLDRIDDRDPEVKQSAVRGLGALKRPVDLKPLLNQFMLDAVDAATRQEDPPVHADYRDALKATVRWEHLDTLYTTLTHANPHVEKMGLDLISHVGDNDAVPTLFQYLKNSKSRFLPDGVRVLLQCADGENRPLLRKELDAPDPLSRKTAAQGLAKTRITADLPVVITRLEKEAEADVQTVLHDTVDAFGANKDAFPILTKNLANNTHPPVLLAVADALMNYPTLQALPPLFDALDQRGNLPQTVVDRLNTNILKISRDTISLPFLLEKETSANPRVKAVAQSGIINMVQNWEKTTGYDDDPVLETVRGLGQHANPAIADQSRQTFKAFIQAKVTEVQGIAEKGDFGQGEYFDRCPVPSSMGALLKRAAGKNDQAVVQAAAQAIDRLRERRDQYEKQTADTRLATVTQKQESAQGAHQKARRSTTSKDAKQHLGTANRAYEAASEEIEALTRLHQFAITPDAIHRRLTQAKTAAQAIASAVDSIDEIEKDLRQAEAIAAAQAAAEAAEDYEDTAQRHRNAAASASSSSSAYSYARQASSAASNADAKADEIERIKQWAVRPGELDVYLRKARSAASNASSYASQADSHGDTLKRKEDEEERERRREAAERAARSSSSHGSSGRGGGGGAEI